MPATELLTPPGSFLERRYPLVTTGDPQLSTDPSDRAPTMFREGSVMGSLRDVDSDRRRHHLPLLRRSTLQSDERRVQDVLDSRRERAACMVPADGVTAWTALSGENPISRE
jgi:hypothetical protein